MANVVTATSPHGNHHVSIMLAPQPISFGHAEFLTPFFTTLLRKRAGGNRIPKKIPTFLTMGSCAAVLSSAGFTSDTELYRLMGVPTQGEGSDIISFVSRTNRTRDKGFVFIFDRYDEETRTVLNGWLKALGRVPILLVGEESTSVFYIEHDKALIDDLNSDVPTGYVTSTERNREAVHNVRSVHPVSDRLFILSLLPNSCDELVVTHDAATGIISTVRVN